MPKLTRILFAQIAMPVRQRVACLALQLTEWAYLNIAAAPHPAAPPSCSLLVPAPNLSTTQEANTEPSSTDGKTLL
jgi:hypothetical protein